MRAGEFCVFSEQLEQTVEIQMEQYRGQRQERALLQGQPVQPMEDLGRPGQENQQRPTVPSHCISRCELRQAKVVLPLLKKRCLVPPPFPSATTSSLSINSDDTAWNVLFRFGEP